jgi:hypothetical protein
MYVVQHDEVELVSVVTEDEVLAWAVESAARRSSTGRGDRVE